MSSAGGMRWVYLVGNTGTAQVAQYLKSGYGVICIEPNPLRAQRLARDFGRESCIVLNVALGTREETLRFYVDRSGELVAFENFPGACEIGVRVRTFASVLTEFGAPYFVRLASERPEREAVLKSLTAETAPQFLSFEADEKTGECLLHLQTIGFRWFNISAQHVRAPTTTAAPQLRWSADQALRIWLIPHREHPSRMTPLGADDWERDVPAMEVRTGWRDIDRTLHDLSMLTSSDSAETVWFDMHAARSLPRIAPVSSEDRSGLVQAGVPNRNPRTN
jgi:FkbM family methyltransferase